MPTQQITPLSASLLLPALRAAARSLASHLTLPLPPDPDPVDLLPWRRQHIAGAVVGAWQADPALVAALWQAPDRPLQSAPAAKAKKASKLATQWLAEAEGERQRLQRWAAGVQTMSWSQAQLLQVMEEVEPMLAAAFTQVDKLAWLSTGVATQLITLLQRQSGDDALQLAMSLLQGLPTPAVQQVEDWAQGKDPQAWQQAWGHWAASELELAVPRLSEYMPTWPTPPAHSLWQPQRAADEAAEARQAAIKQAGLLQRNRLRKTLDLCRAALLAYGQARDSLARVQQAVRTWILAAADEGAQGDRIRATQEIFQLEIEEIKQMLTGEWHDRSFIARQIAQRQPLQLALPACTQSLTLHGEIPQAPITLVDDITQEVPEVDGGVAVTPNLNPLWTPVVLTCTGIICTADHWLGHAAELARGGGLALRLAVNTEFSGN